MLADPIAERWRQAIEEGAKLRSLGADAAGGFPQFRQRRAVPVSQRGVHDAPILTSAGEHDTADLSRPGLGPQVAVQMLDHLLGTLGRHPLIVGGNFGVRFQETVTGGQYQYRRYATIANMRPVRLIHDTAVQVQRGRRPVELPT
ncbi:hypothetical protein CT19425_U350068 [Cupriavidus taiwanensis]|uniref:Uncharacterized protein n=1 Tax=Cupriavidus taiwanensis TaxID=164546 RepID=A0A375I7L8_9BURK|nr:hypothetical protein CT19425_U350068 [Cupriavidus taiwanensis]